MRPLLVFDMSLQRYNFLAKFGEHFVRGVRLLAPRGPAVSFLLAFFLPLILVGVVVRVLQPSIKGEELFPGSLRVDESRVHYTLQAVPVGEGLRVSPILDPQVAKDFLLVSWFRLDRHLADGQRMTLLSKLDDVHSGSGGYALTLEGVGSKVRPSILWRAGKVGRLYPLSEVEIPSREWFFIAITFYKQKFLGGYFGVWDSGRKRAYANTLGGHELSLEVLPSTTEPLVIGPPSDGSFRGFVGPILLAQGDKLAKDIPLIMKEVSKNPTLVPSILNDREEVFWLPRVPASVPSIFRGVSVTIEGYAKK